MNNRNVIKVLAMVSHNKELLALFSGMVLIGAVVLTMALAAGIRYFT